MSAVKGKAAKSGVRLSAKTRSPPCAPGNASSRAALKHRCCRAALLLALPGAQGGDRVFAERRTPLFAAFPLTADIGSCPQRDVVPAEPAYLGDAQARLDPQEQQRPIASPHPRLLIRRCQQHLDL